jgi:hypothetical protein
MATFYKKETIEFGIKCVYNLAYFVLILCIGFGVYIIEFTKNENGIIILAVSIIAGLIGFLSLTFIAFISESVFEFRHDQAGSYF